MLLRRRPRGLTLPSWGSPVATPGLPCSDGPGLYGGLLSRCAHHDLPCQRARPSADHLDQQRLSFDLPSSTPNLSLSGPV
jgi:hypothetical protein